MSFTGITPNVQAVAAAFNHQKYTRLQVVVFRDLSCASILIQFPDSRHAESLYTSRLR